MMSSLLLNCMKFENNKFVIVIIFYLLFPIFNYGQQAKLTCTVKDSQTGKVLPYCNVYIQGTNKGTITNADGVFNITADPAKDILEFSYLGYETKTIFASHLKNNKNVYLQKSTYELQEVEIHADNDYLYRILSNSRKKLKKNYIQNISKSYYCVETKVTPLEVIYPNPYHDSINNLTFVNHIYEKQEQHERSAEILECLYNASIIGAKINNFAFRNGRAFIPTPEENYFMTLSSSQAIGTFCYFEENEIFPTCPFQYNKRTMKKVFNLELLSFDGKKYHIKYYPHNNISESFSGEDWIEKETSQVLKLRLNIEDAKICPLEPLFSFDTIKNFSMNVTYSFNPINNYLPDYTFFDYDFNYVSRRDTIVRDQLYKRTISKISSNGLVYYYDYNKPFVLPYFTYNYNFNDYILMSFIPYNEVLWNSNDIVQLTRSQKQQIRISDDYGNNKNQLDIKDGKIKLKKHSCDDISFFEFYYVFWSAEKRVILSSPSIYNNISKDVNKMQFPSDLYNLKVQILLDVTEVDDSIVCKSWTVFDTMETFYKYTETSNTKAFFNIYFDICEIERRKMQKQLDENKYSLTEID
ncbi:MAG: carboxypeptidase-like regulatory domain-containing protein, partial [Bacteroidales bacterium]|nr:carboxypeptidase-like regulatory domain-containing protein [Bacteroidales bacterium]